MNVESMKLASVQEKWVMGDSPPVLHLQWQRARCAAFGIVQDLVDAVSSACSRVDGVCASNATISWETYNWQLRANGLSQFLQCFKDSCILLC
jgi:hypothetical protein